jgi:transcriptional regulator with XRE-family HTH domain
METEITGEMVRQSRTEIPRLLGYDERWTQVKLAIVLGVESNYIAMVERNERQPSELFKRALKFVLQLAQHGIDPSTL